MAVRRLNFTNRKRIKQEHARVTLYLQEEGPASFDVDLTLDDYDLEPSHRVHLEAYRQSAYMRFDFGTVGSITSPLDRYLSDFSSPEEILFRIKITSLGTEHGKLIAVADKIRHRAEGEEEEDRVPLLSVISQDLDDRIYRIDFDGDMPKLVINSRLGNTQSIARNPVFISLVYPSALREILVRILVIEKYFETEDTLDWKAQWLKFSTNLPGIYSIPSDTDENVLYEWIENCVSSFCRIKGIRSSFEDFWAREGSE